MSYHGRHHDDFSLPVPSPDLLTSPVVDPRCMHVCCACKVRVGLAALLLIPLWPVPRYQALLCQFRCLDAGCRGCAVLQLEVLGLGT
jgi:hypothetical protein